MKSDMIYVVIIEGDVEFASRDKESAYSYAEDVNYREREKVLDDWEIDDPNEKDLGDAEYEVGLGGRFAEVHFVDIANYDEDDEIVLSDGTSVDCYDILERLKENDS